MSRLVYVGSTEGRLCGHLVASVARSFSKGKKGAPINHISQSYWRNFADAAAEFGLASRDGLAAAYLFDADDMPDLLATSVSADDVRIGWMLPAFWGVACSFEPDVGKYLSDERGWFRPSKGYITAMLWLARTGYAEHDCRQFRWTDMIAPAMRAAYLWTDDGQSLTTMRYDDLKTEATLALKTMPDTLKHALRSESVGFIELLQALALGWKDGKWRSYRIDESFELTGQTELARLISRYATEDIN